MIPIVLDCAMIPNARVSVCSRQVAILEVTLRKFSDVRHACVVAGVLASWHQHEFRIPCHSAGSINNCLRCMGTRAPRNAANRLMVDLLPKSHDGPTVVEFRGCGAAEFEPYTLDGNGLCVDVAGNGHPRRSSARAWADICRDSKRGIFSIADSAIPCRGLHRLAAPGLQQVSSCGT